MGRTCSTHWRDENTCNTLTGKPKGKRPYGRPKHRWETILA